MEIKVNVKFEIMVTTPKTGKIKLVKRFDTESEARQEIASIKKKYKHDKIILSETWKSVFLNDLQYRVYKKAMSDMEIRLNSTREEIIAEIRKLSAQEMRSYLDD